MAQPDKSQLLSTIEGPSPPACMMRSVHGSYREVQVITSPLGPVKGGKFGKNVALSADGRWLAVTEDYNGTVYVYGK